MSQSCRAEIRINFRLAATVNEINIEFVENPSSELIEAVNFQLREHNRTSNKIFWEESGKKERQPQLVKIFAFGPDRTVIGGLFGTTQFSWLKIDIMSVRSEYRGRGIGQALLAQAEAFAKERGCKYAYADTMEYQAPEFYRKAGYNVTGQLDDWDSYGHRKYFFVKDLS